MKKVLLCLIVFISLTISLSACVPLASSAQDQVSEAYIQTAVAKTSQQKGLWLLVRLYPSLKPQQTELRQLHLQKRL